MASQTPDSKSSQLSAQLRHNPLAARLNETGSPSTVIAQQKGFNVTLPAKQAKALYSPAPPSAPKLNPIAKYTPQPEAALSSTLTRPRSSKQVEPLPKPSRGTLPALEITMNKPKVLPDVRKNSPPSTIELKAMTTIQVAQYVRQHGNDIGFVYLVRTGAKSSSNYHAYNLRVAQHEEIDQSDFFTMSPAGVTHTHDGCAEFTPLDRWEKEYRDFHELRRLKTFRQFRMWKGFSVWRKNLFTAKLEDRRHKLQANLFIINDHLRAALVQVRRLCLDLRTVNLCSINTRYTYTLDEFVESQNKQSQVVQNVLKTFREQVKTVVLGACTSSIKDAAYSQVAEEEKSTRTPGKDVKAAMTYTEQAAKRNHCILLTNFVRLIDYLVANALQSLVVDSTADLRDKLETIINYTNRLDEEFKKAVDAASAAAAASTSADGKAKAPIRVSRKAIKLPNEPDLQAMFKIELMLEAHHFAFEPTKEEFATNLQEVMFSFQESVTDTESLLKDAEFDDVTHPTINNRVEDLAGAEGVSLSSIFEDDVQLASLTGEVGSQLDKVFAKCDAYAASLENFREMVAENASLDLEWVRTADHTPHYFADALAKYKQMYSDACAIDTEAEVGPILIDCTTLKNEVMPSPLKCLDVIQSALPKNAALKNHNVLAAIDIAVTRLEAEPATTVEYVECITYISSLEKVMQDIEDQVKCVTELYELIDRFQIDTRPEDLAEYQTLRNAVQRARDAAKKRSEEKDKLVNKFCDELDKDISSLGTEVLAVRNDAQADIISNPNSELDQVITYMEQLNERMNTLQERASQYKAYQKSFNVEVTKFTALEETHAEVRSKKLVWDSVRDWSKVSTQWETMPFETLNADEVSSQVNRMVKQVYTLMKSLPANEVIPNLQVKLERMKDKLPLIADLRNPSLKPRHWERIDQVLGSPLPHDETFTLLLLNELDVWKFKEALQEISTAASSEAALETMLKKVDDAWKKMEFPVLPYRESKDVFILGGLDEVQALLDDSQVNIATIAGSRHVGPIKVRVEDWQRQLNLFAETLEEWLNCQRSWLYLESIFSAPDIQRQLPVEAKMFLEVDKSFKEAMRKTAAFPNAIRAGCTPGFLEMFRKNNSLLEQIQKCLEDYLESKRMVFSRFFFLSNDELLEILSQTRNPLAVQPHMRKCFDAIQSLEFGVVPGSANSEEGIKYTNDIYAMVSPEKERVAFGKGLKARGNVEVWLCTVEEAMVKSLHALTKAGLIDYSAKSRRDWMKLHASQVVLTVSQIMWCHDVTLALTSENPVQGLRDFEKKCQQQLADAAALSRENIPKLFRGVLGALITIDVHARDIITGMIEANVSSLDDFEWTRQLRYYWDEEIDDCVVRMSNSRYVYAYEYLGASPRLVITPLTDRCYLCLMGALQLDLGGAPAGPAGTGKTETTKDMAKALGTQCVVFNCSEGLDYRMMGKFFSGLAQSGAWCCFDEFNRIDIEVLSVIAQQILTIRNAKVAKVTRFMFEGREIRLIPKCAAFITMNPGYAGRTELPDNLKALFRPFAMMVPDYGLIAEVILFSEGFEDPKNLARKMVQMYKLCSEQLSQQDHYDFGMRAVKSVLVMAGSLKRDRAKESEASVLLTALRDSNLPKFLSEDSVLFNAILSDLFPGVRLPEHDYGQLQAHIQKAMVEKHLEVTTSQTKKVIQLYETMVVRHGVMLVGPTGGGKTTVYEVLQRALTSLSEAGISHPDYKPVNTYVLNPKSISMGELYGEVNTATGEWTDGLLANQVRFSCNAGITSADHQWIICDGPVDALWIENMNTVLDDNKMLCLANSERIKLTPHIHMMFEVQDLAVASPATVSRCGMVYVDPVELGWKPYVKRWIETLTKLDEGRKEYLLSLFDTFVSKGLYFVRKSLSEAIPQVDIAKIATLTYLLEELLFGTDTKVDISKLEDDQVRSVLANVFFFAFVWGLGGNLTESSQEAFDNHVRDAFGEIREVKMPGVGTVFDYYIDFSAANPSLQNWESLVPTFQYNREIPFFDMLVPTVTTVKYSFVMSKLLNGCHPVLFTGITGVGKSVIAKDCLKSLEAKNTIPVLINFSAQTSSKRTQEIIESKLEKKRKNIMGAPNNKKIVIFVDDLNMPRLDRYGAQPPIELLRQYQDFRGFYDRDKLFWKEISDVTLAAACAPPGGGRNPVTPRFIRHFSMFCVPTANERTLASIFNQITNGFFAEGFSKPVQKAAQNVVAAAVEIYARMSTDLLPTPAKSHYIFNLRDLSKCIQGVLQADSSVIREEVNVFDLFCHESMRVFHDRLINLEDKTYFCNILAEITSKQFGKSVDQDYFSKIIYGDFMKVGAPAQDRVYEKADMQKIQAILEEYLDQYNMESSKEMKIVFFMDAIEHVSRIARMIRQPRGNALLVGVGGTGKQSLTRMACHMVGYKCFQIEINRGYGHTEFREDLKKLYDMAGSKGQDTVFLFTDTQIVVEEFLEDINNILNSGEVPNLFESDEIERYLQPVRPLAKEAGYPETRDGVFQFLVNRVREKLHVVLCMSPVGDAFRSRCRMFPSIVNCSTIDWFTEWPHEALLNVAKRFFEFVDLGSDSLKSKISEMCVNIHTSVRAMADRFYDELRRKYYTTPTSYLELINLYTSMLDTKRRELILARDRFQTGLDKLLETNSVVETMQTELTALAPVLKQKSEDTSKLMEKLKVDKAEADQVRAVVQKEEAIAKKEAAETELIKADAQRDLDTALPALDAANKALDALDKKDVQEVKVFNTPPELVQVVMEAVCILFDRKTDWKTAKNLLGESDFLKMLQTFDKDNIPDRILKKLKTYIDNPKFQPDVIEKVSRACKSLCMWVRACDLYARVYRQVEPKRQKLAEAQASLAATMGNLKEKQAVLAAVENKIASLQQQYTESITAKEQLENNMLMTSARLGRASKLQTALGDEQVRWSEAVQMYNQQVNDVAGNVFLAAACVAYFGAFTSLYRQELVSSWVVQCEELGIPVSKTLSIANVLSTPYQIREWNSNGLPRDQLSTENAVLVTCGRRWPLMIDPQDQANNWIRKMEGRNGLKIIKLTEPNFLRTLENAIRTGAPVLLEEVLETLDPALEPILLKQTFKQGGRLMIRLGDSDIDYDKNFRFYMTSKLANPHYLPEICIKVTVINFTVTRTGLEDQLLSDVVRLERPDLEEQRSKLIVQINEDKNQLKAIEDKILKLLFNSQGNILDDEVLINTLNDSKTTSAVIAQRLIQAESTEANITEAREKYRPAATRGSVIFFSIADMANIDPMYQYSLEYVKQLFNTCISQSEPSKNLEVRLANIIAYSTKNIFINVSRGLFERHKPIFAFMLCAEIMKQRGDVSDREWNYLLRGAGASDQKRPAKPSHDWLAQATWNEVCDLESSLPDLFAGLAADFIAAPLKIQLGFMSAVLNKDSWPDCGSSTTIDWNEKLTSFQKLILIRSLRDELVTAAVAEFVTLNLDKSFVESPPVELPTLYKDISKTVPLIFVLSVGSDPMTSFLRFAREMNYSERVHAISLGQGQGPVAEKMINAAKKNGDWVFLQNCHLARSWMNSMEIAIKAFNDPREVIHEDFRLFLSSAPCDFFPVSVLQNSVKVTNEPPKGLRANVRGAFSSMTQTFFEDHPMGRSWKKLIFALCFFHGIIQERKKFGPLGWNIKYEFSNSDRECALDNLRLFLEEGKIPWDALQFITGDITYGGRVTDTWDQRCLRTMLRRFFTPKCLEEEYKYSSSGIYYSPSFSSLKQYTEYVESLPFQDDPEIFGMHANADLAFQREETRSLLGTILDVQPRLVASGGAKTPDQIVYELAEMIQDKLPRVKIDLDLAKEGTFELDGRGQVKSLSTVLRQEIDRFNNLLRVLWSSLDNIKKAIKGLVVMSADLEKIYTSFLNNQVPGQWASAAYPSLKPLGSWVKDLALRLSFVSDWLKKGQPRSFWLSGLFFPQGFLTGVLQEHARKYNLPIDTLSFEFAVQAPYIHQESGFDSVELPSFNDGVLVHGLFMDACRWDDDHHIVVDSHYGQMQSELPAMHMMPRQNFTRPADDYVAPLYKTSVRAGVLSTTGHSTNFVVSVHLPSKQNSDYWVCKGAALLTQLDA